MSLKYLRCSSWWHDCMHILTLKCIVCDVVLNCHHTTHTHVHTDRYICLSQSVTLSLTHAHTHTHTQDTHIHHKHTLTNIHMLEHIHTHEHIHQSNKRYQWSAHKYLLFYSAQHSVHFHSFRKRCEEGYLSLCAITSTLIRVKWWKKKEHLALQITCVLACAIFTRHTLTNIHMLEHIHTHEHIHQSNKRYQWSVKWCSKCLSAPVENVSFAHCHTTMADSGLGPIRLPTKPSLYLLLRLLHTGQYHSHHACSWPNYNAWFVSFNRWLGFHLNEGFVLQFNKSC